MNLSFPVPQLQKMLMIDKDTSIHKAGMSHFIYSLRHLQRTNWSYKFKRLIVQ